MDKLIYLCRKSSRLPFKQAEVEQLKQVELENSKQFSFQSFNVNNTPVFLPHTRMFVILKFSLSVNLMCIS